MNKHISFVITAAVLVTAMVTVGLYTAIGAHAQGNMTGGAAKNMTGGAAKNMTNATGGAAKMAVAKMAKNATGK